MSEKFDSNEISEEIQNIDEEEVTAEAEDSAVTENEVQEQYKKLPMWQQMLLVILCLFGMAAVVVLIDFVVEFGIELLQRIL